LTAYHNIDAIGELGSIRVEYDTDYEFVGEAVYPDRISEMKDRWST
jgi:hypothetical protein